MILDSDERFDLVNRHLGFLLRRLGYSEPRREVSALHEKIIFESEFNAVVLEIDLRDEIADLAVAERVGGVISNRSSGGRSGAYDYVANRLKKDGRIVPKPAGGQLESLLRGLEFAVEAIRQNGDWLAAIGRP